MSITFAPAYKDAEGRFVHVENDAVTVNQSNANAMMTMEWLQIEPDYCGSLPTQEFLGRALLALVTTTELDDRPVFPVDYKRAGGPNMIDAGTREGYRTDVLNRLAELASHCLVQEVEFVAWA